MAIAFVVAGSGGSTDSNGFTTGSIDTTGANFIVISLATGNANQGAVSDSKSNTWTALTQIVGGFGDRWSQFFYCENPTVGSGHTFSVTGTANFPALAISAFSGVATSSSFDVQNGDGGGFGTSQATGSITPSANNELLVASLNYDDGNSTPTIDAGFTVATTFTNTGFGHSDICLAYIIETTATAKNPTFSWANGSRGIGNIASFKAAAGASAPVSGWETLGAQTVYLKPPKAIGGSPQ